MMTNVNISSPWIIFVKKLQAFFDKDPDVTVKYDDIDPYTVALLVDDTEKYFALSILLPQKLDLGNIEFTIYVIPANCLSYDPISLFKMVFKNSPIVESINTIKPEGTSNPFTYISFKNEVVKYHSDTLGDPHGNSFTLYQDLANDIFDMHDGVYFTTAEN